MQQVSLQQSTYGCDIRSASSTTSASRASSRIRQELTCTACSSSLERAARISVRKRWVVACTRKHMLPPLCSGTWQQNLKTMYFIDAFLEAWPCHKVPLNPSFVAPTVFGTLLQLHDLRSQRDNFGSNASSGSSSIVPRGTWAWRAEKTPFSVCCLEFRRGSKPSTHMTLKKKRQQNTKWVCLKLGHAKLHHFFSSPPKWDYSMVYPPVVKTNPNVLSPVAAAFKVRDTAAHLHQHLLKRLDWRIIGRVVNLELFLRHFGHLEKKRQKAPAIEFNM